MYDVIVVGSGPVGMAAAAFLGRAGRKVLVLERYQGLYGLPRAATFDDETMRTFDRLGIAERLQSLVHFQPTYEWRNAAGDLLLELQYAERGESGWAQWYQMYQPDVEDALFAAGRESGNVEFRFGVEVQGYEQSSDAVEVITTAGTESAAYVVAADGGNGMSRGAIGARYEDYGFSEPWLVCDFEYHDDAANRAPRALQLGDPEQPMSIIALGRRHQRVSMMLDSEDDFERVRDPELIWSRVDKYFTPQDADLIRVATYTFRSLVTDRWRDRRVILAGDAAHQMPPFLGQGMVSGIRDARNLAFKIGLVLDGQAGDAILDTYQTERSPHVEQITRKAIELGMIQTTRDPDAAAERDRRMLAARAAGEGAEKLRFPALGDGLVSSRATPARGCVMVQGRVVRNGEPELLDRVFPEAGFQLVVWEGSGKATESSSVDDVIEIGANGLADVDGTYAEWFRENGAVAALVRPDDYVFGTVDDYDLIPELVGELDEALSSSSASSVTTGSVR